jgi:cytochrome c2
MNREFRKNKRVSVLGTLTIVLGLSFSTQTLAAEPGEQEYTTFCGICHTIGGGTLIGPDLAGVHDRRPQEWLEKFVASSTSVIGSGDAYAVELFEKFNKITMPDATVPPEKIKEILNYIKIRAAQPAPATAAATASPATATPADATAPAAPTAAPAAPIKVATEEDILLGQNLFEGTARLEKSGPSCVTCHHIKNDAIIGGGVLAKELTDVFTRLGGTGVRAVLNSTPFPVMQAAYKGKPLSEQEIFALLAFLEDAGAKHLFQHPKDYGTGLLLSGFIGAAVLLVLYSLIWLARKKDSVNQKIFDRQVKSTWE